MSKLETRRDLKTGAISVEAPTFVVVVTESAVRIQVNGEVIHEWRPGVQHADEPPRRRQGKRGSR